MSVIKAKRKPTPFQVTTNFMKLRRAVTKLIQESFKYKPKGTDIDADFAQWFIGIECDAVFKLLKEADRYITMANSIFPVYLHEYEQRRELQNVAIGLCFDILQEFQYILDALDIDINGYAEYVGLIGEEIRLLRAWRQADNKKRKALLKQEQK